MSAEVLGAALAYARAGNPTFPCAPGGKRPPTKHPRKGGLMRRSARTQKGCAARDSNPEPAD